MENKFKVGDKVRYLGTKDGVKDENWDTYFGSKGIKKGSIGEIDHTSGDMYYISKDGRDSTSGFLKECDIELVSKRNYKKPTHLVVWEEDRDPCRFFQSEQDAKEFIKELSEKSDVKKESIILVEIKSCKKVSIMKSLRYAEHKV